MRSAFTVYRKELRAYLVSPIPYVAAIIFTTFMGWWFFYWNDSQFFVIGKATLETGFFSIMPWVLLFLVPAIGMRLWSEEVRGGTLEALMTLPVPAWSLVVGKFFAAWTLLLLCLVLTLPIPFTVSGLGDLDWGPVLGGYLGALLFGGALLSLGVWISALTRHQIIAFLITMVVGFGLIIIQWLGSPGGGSIFSAISLRSHYDALGRGVIDLRDLLYFASFTGFFLYLNVQAIDNRRYR